MLDPQAQKIPMPEIVLMPREANQEANYIHDMLTYKNAYNIALARLRQANDRIEKLVIISNCFESSINVLNPV